MPRGPQPSANRDTEARRDAGVVENQAARAQGRDVGTLERGRRFFSRLLHSNDTPDENHRGNEQTRHSSSVGSTPRSDIPLVQGRGVVPGLSRPLTVKRFPSEPGDRLLESPLGPETQRLVEEIQTPLDNALAEARRANKVLFGNEKADYEYDYKGRSIEDDSQRQAEDIHNQMSSYDDDQDSNLLSNVQSYPADAQMLRSEKLRSSASFDHQYEQKLIGVRDLCIKPSILEATTKISLDLPRFALTPTTDMVIDEDKEGQQALESTAGSAIGPSALSVEPHATNSSTTTSRHESRPACSIDSNPETYGWGYEHLVLGSTDEEMLQVINHLGKVSLGFVEEVRCRNSQVPTFVRKRVMFPPSNRQAFSHLMVVQEEAKILRSLIHPHIVTLLESYEDNLKSSRRRSYCLLMSPVGENDLEAFLAVTGDCDVTSDELIQWRSRIRNWMCCLASALRYMHASGIRHQDSKPSNIIQKGNQVFFTDFSSSATFRTGHITSTENPARSTCRYGAPEATSDRGKHGRSTDIFALGCMFPDILSVAEGRTVHDFQYLHRHDDKLAVPDTGRARQALSYSEKVPQINEWFNDSPIFKACISPMLHAERGRRPATAEVLQSLVLNNSGDRNCICLRDGLV
ncbi:ATP binding [Ascochyta rabiei]|uniref:ATP binding n=1 Tax=Didymella rabiei TaxID=5454 RepID=A0A163BM44_DIDRA|nr:ATP binding [Ascochyta rabiei]